MKDKKFRVRNDPFLCAHCGRDVPATAAATPRNHCPFCLWCMHVDVNPGDRANGCRGTMRPIGIYAHAKKSYVILHECQRCKARTKAKAILKDKNAADDFDLILELSGKPIEEDHQMLKVTARSRR